MDPPVAESPRAGASTLVARDRPVPDDGPVMEDSPSITEGAVLGLILEEDDDNAAPLLPRRESDVMRGAGIRGSGFRVLEGSIGSSLSSGNTIASLVALKDEVKRRRYPVAWAVGFVAFVIPAAIPSIGDKYAREISWYIFFGFNAIFGMYYFGLHHYYERLEGGDREEARRPTASTADEESVANEQLGPALEAAMMAAPPPPSDEEKETKSRLDFLDNVKTFLTVVVILYHVCMGFGAQPYATLVINYNDNAWAKVVSAGFLEPSSKYVASLFYFVSAYFVPKSLAEKGRVKFLKDRARRILCGALLATLVLMPLATLWAACVSSYTRGLTGTSGYYRYRPSPGTAWFLWWLFFLDLWYASTIDASDGGYRLPLSKYLAKFPSSILRRWSVGALVCGVLNKLVERYLLRDALAFAFMPASQFVNNLLFFYVGLIAGQNRWLEPSDCDDDDGGGQRLSARLGANVWLLRASALAWYGATAALSLGVHDALPAAAKFVAESVAHGLWTMEFSVLLLGSFRQHAGSRTSLSSWMARHGYGAYLLQNVFVFTTPVAVFVYAYNACGPGTPISFSPGSTVSSTEVPTAPLVVGWAYACLVYAAMCYVGACVLRRLPGLKHVV